MASRNPNFAVVTLPVCAAVLLVGAWLTSAGDLNPPAGPVAPTMKTLVEVEPRTAINAANTPGDADSFFKITQPGSYYLTGNITGVVGKHGIEIADDGVTLDLNGFDVRGVLTMSEFDGVVATGIASKNIAVVNGSIRHWGGNGVNLGDFAIGCRIENVRAYGNLMIGINSGSNSQVSNCSAVGGTYGIHVNYSSTISNCSARSASTSGFYAEIGAAFVNCSAHFNQGSGFIIGQGSTVSNCSATGNSNGMIIGPTCAITTCSASSNNADGFSMSSGSTITHCTASSNFGSGIVADSRCTVADCTADFNSDDGIVCNQSCLIRANTCAQQLGGAGIHAAQTDNRIEGNNCTNSERGIQVDDPSNIIIKNTCSGNSTNWDVVAGNTILVVQGSSAGDVLGNTGGTAPGSTDPNANFTY